MSRYRFNRPWEQTAGEKLLDRVKWELLGKGQLRQLYLDSSQLEEQRNGIKVKGAGEEEGRQGQDAHEGQRRQPGQG